MEIHTVGNTWYTHISNKIHHIYMQSIHNILETTCNPTLNFTSLYVGIHKLHLEFNLIEHKSHNRLMHLTCMRKTSCSKGETMLLCYLSVLRYFLIESIMLVIIIITYSKTLAKKNKITKD